MTEDILEEGIVFNKWMYNRLIKKNQNVLGCDTGPTGSGKSYRQLRMMELWYKYYFDEKVPAENIHFEPYEVIKLIASDKLRRGDIIMFEEAGVSMNNLDFQKRQAKMMNYILQTFRFKNYAIFFNLPYLTLLNKTARMLLHFNFESASIDRDTKINYCKPKFLQVNQQSGKVYSKYPVTKVNHRYTKVKRLGYKMPSPYLVKIYEDKKKNFFDRLTKDMVFDIEEVEREQLKKRNPDRLSKRERELFPFIAMATNLKDLAKISGFDYSHCSDLLKNMRNKGFDTKFKEFPKKIGDLGTETPLVAI